MSRANLDRYLPIELLHEIFSYLCLPDDFFIHRTDSDLVHLPGESLSQVSSYWRAATLGYPPLFSVADWMSWSLHKLEAWADRGADAGLSAFAVFGPRGQDDPSEDRLRLLISRSHLWRSLIVRSGSVLPPHTKISSLFVHEAPRLRSLTVHNIGQRPLRPISIRNLSPDFAPSLCCLDLYEVYFRGKRLPQWRLLETVVWVSAEQQYLEWSFLEAWSSSRYLAILGGLDPNAKVIITPPPASLSFPHLEYLSIHHHRHEVLLQPIFEKGLAPRLRILELGLEDAGDLTVWGTLLSYVPFIEDFRVRLPRLRLVDFLQKTLLCSHILPTLHHLTISHFELAEAGRYLPDNRRRECEDALELMGEERGLSGSASLKTLRWIDPGLNAKWAEHFRELDTGIDFQSSDDPGGPLPGHRLQVLRFRYKR